jgi:hypothetical protein
VTTVNPAIADTVTYTIALTTGQQATVGQVDIWGFAIQNGNITEQGMVNAFVGSSAFATQNNGGAVANPNAAPTTLEATNVIDHALGGSNSTQVNAWVDGGDTLGQMVDAFVHNGTFEASVNSGLFFTDGSTSTSLQIPPAQETPVSATPLPSTLPLFAAGLALGLLGWRRKWKAVSAAR